MNALRVVHETRYDYGAPVGYGLQRLRVRPKSDAWQRVIDWSVTIEGGADGIRFGDEHGNDTDLIVLDRDVERLGLRVEGTVEPLVSDGVYGPHDGLAPLALYVHPTLLTMAGRGVVSLAGSGTDLAAMHDLSARILDRVTFDTAVGEAAQNAEIIIKQGAGVCQDHAHVMIACARYLGLPARYVSGYLLLDDRTEQDAGHAWVEVHLEHLGWVGFDVSNGYSPDRRYVRVAVGRDGREAAPVQGLVFGQPSERLSVRLRVEQVSQQQ